MRLIWGWSWILHEEAAAQELPGNLFCRLGWRDEPVGVRRGTGTGTNTCSVQAAGRKTYSIPASGFDGGPSSSGACRRWKSLLPNRGRTVHLPKGLAEFYNVLLLATSCNVIPQRKRGRVEKICRPSPAGLHPQRTTLSAPFYRQESGSVPTQRRCA